MVDVNLNTLHIQRSKTSVYTNSSGTGLNLEISYRDVFSDSERGFALLHAFGQSVLHKQQTPASSNCF